MTKMGKRPIISGTAMAVLLGFLAVLAAVFPSSLDFNTKITLGVMGVFMIAAGILFSKG